MTLIEVKDRLNLLGYTVTLEDEPLIYYLINKVTQDVKNITNLLVLPEEIEYLLIEITCGEFLKNKQLTNQLGDYDTDNALKKLTEGDVSIEYDPKSNQNAKTSLLISYLTDHDKDLIKFRRILW